MMKETGKNMNITKKISEELKIQLWQAETAINLIDEGNTIPFIARYRKEKTGSLNDEVLRNLDERLKYLRNLEERKEAVIVSIEEQGKLTDELKQQIMQAETLVAVEDLYRPYKQKKRTRATIAKEKGLENEFALYDRVERLAKEEIMTHRKMFKPVCANVDFYSGFVYTMLGIPEELFTPIFAIARIAGWSAHRLEELLNAGKIIRPAYKYVGHHTEFYARDERE